MMPDAVISARWWSLLVLIDTGIALSVKRARCPCCGGRLDSGHYARKVRGLADGQGSDAELRWSWCCSRDGCRKRVTPPSVRFWSRLVYAGAVVLALAGELPKTPSGERLRSLIGCARQTWTRWRLRLAGLWETATGRMIAGWLTLSAQHRSCVSEVLSLWPGSWPFQAARWQLLIHPLTGGTNWEKPVRPHGPLDTQKMDVASPLAALEAVPRSF